MIVITFTAKGIPLKLGILQCDSVLEEYQNKFGNYPQMFIDLFKQIDPNIDLQVYNVEFGEYPGSPEECDAYITTGSKASVYEELPWLAEFKTFIRRLHDKKIKLAGVCFGHQLIADTFGGKTEKSDKGWGVGVSINKIITQQPWMHPPLEQLNIIVSHQDQVIRLPENAELLASSEFCPNYMFQLDDTIVSLQGHPEFSKEYSETLMTHRQVKIGETAYKRAIESLKLDTHEIIYARWLLNFFTNK